MPTTQPAAAYPVSCWQRSANDPQPLHGGMLACVLDALANGTPEARKLGQELTAGHQVIAWTCPELPWLALHTTAATDRLALVTDALGAQAFAYADDGLTISAGDCWWLIAKLRGGVLQLATASRIAAARDRSEANPLYAF